MVFYQLQSEITIIDVSSVAFLLFYTWFKYQIPYNIPVCSSPHAYILTYTLTRYVFAGESRFYQFPQSLGPHYIPKSISCRKKEILELAFLKLYHRNVEINRKLKKTYQALRWLRWCELGHLQLLLTLQDQVNFNFWPIFASTMSYWLP